MHIDHPVALFVDQRRQFVHMVAVIGVVIGVFLHPFPTCGQQHRLYRAQVCAGDHDVEVADMAALGCLQSGGGIGGAFHQNDLVRVIGQRPARAIGLPQGRALLIFGIGAFIGQDRRDRIRQHLSGQPIG